MVSQEEWRGSRKDSVYSLSLSNFNKIIRYILVQAQNLHYLERRFQVLSNSLEGTDDHRVQRYKDKSAVVTEIKRLRNQYNGRTTLVGTVVLEEITTWPAKFSSILDI